MAAAYDYLLAFHPSDSRRNYGGVAAVGSPLSFYNGPWATVGWWGFSHEVGHSWGLRHAFALVDGEPVEYAGGSDIMGVNPGAPSLGMMYSIAEKHAMHILPPATLFEADAGMAALPRRTARATVLGVERPDFVAAAAGMGSHAGVRWQRSSPGTAVAPWTSRWVYATWRSLLYAPNATPALPFGGAGLQLHYQSYAYDEMGYDGLATAFFATPPGRTLGWASPPLQVDSTPYSRWLQDAAVPVNSAFVDGAGTGTPVLVRVREGPAVPGSGLGMRGDRTLAVEMAALDARTLERAEGRGCWLRGSGGSPGCQLALAAVPTHVCNVTATLEVSVNRSARNLIVALALPATSAGPLAVTMTSCSARRRDDLWLVHASRRVRHKFEHLASRHCKVCRRWRSAVRGTLRVKWSLDGGVHIDLVDEHCVIPRYAQEEEAAAGSRRCCQRTRPPNATPTAATPMWRCSRSCSQRRSKSLVDCSSSGSDCDVPLVLPPAHAAAPRIAARGVEDRVGVQHVLREYAAEGYPVCRNERSQAQRRLGAWQCGFQVHPVALCDFSLEGHSRAGTCSARKRQKRKHTQTRNAHAHQPMWPSEALAASVHQTQPRLRHELHLEEARPARLQRRRPAAPCRKEAR